MRNYLLIFVTCLTLLLTTPGSAMQEDSLEQQFIEMMVRKTIIAFEHPQSKEKLKQFSELIKNEHSYQFIIQKIDKFILTNELEQYEDQAEALKEALMEMREFYIEAEQKTLEKYNKMKKQQQEREKQRELNDNQVIEI